MRNLMKYALALGLIVMAPLLCFAADSSDGDKKASAAKTTKDIVVDEISKIRSDNSDFKVEVVPVGGKKKYRVGDELELKFRSNKDAYVTVIDIGTSGKVRTLFPNKWRRDNQVEKDKWYRIPHGDSDYTLKVKGPEGVNFVKVIATRDRFDFVPRTALEEGEGPFAEVKEPETTVKDIAMELKKRNKAGWTESEAKFTIVSGRTASDEETDRERTASETEDEGVRFVTKLWTDKKSYRIGEPVTFYFYAAKDCYLNLINYGTSGKNRVIFPNRLQKDNFVKGGTTVEIPGAKDDRFVLRVQGPPGTERVKAVVTTQRSQVYRGTYDFDKYAYQPWDEKADKIEKDIAVQLNEMPDQNRAKIGTEFRVED